MADGQRGIWVYLDAGRLPPGHLVARGRPLAVTLYGIALMFAAGAAWGTWRNMRKAGGRMDAIPA